MSHLCRECRRVNPDEAAYCYFDGLPLSNGKAAAEASIDFGTWTFPAPFVFPSGDKCHNFVQLALACHRHPGEATEALKGGFLTSFFGSIGRIDLAMAAGAAAKEPDVERGMDDLLGKLPGSPLGAAKLKLDPEEINLGVMQVGQERQLELKLTNEGQ